ncbi:MAG: hypothetical protein GX657_15460 [Chloroflexi bacterium]|nr:hypothetical protein [Chloroflexota bacterium]
MANHLAPYRYIEWINNNLGFNPRSQQQSDHLAQCVVDDLRALCPSIADALDAHQLAYTINMTVWSRVVDRVVDLVIHDRSQPGPLNQALISVENKTIMTAHGKARKNRLGDIVAYCNHVHNHSEQAIAAATIVINTSSDYENPDRFRKNTVRRQLAAEYIRNTMDLFTAIPLRQHVNEPYDQPEALTVILVNYDGIHEAELVTDYPALPPDSPHHYNSFLKRIANLYKERFSS